MKKLLLTILTFSLAIILTACKNDGITFEVLGSNHVSLYINQTYSDKGFIAKDEKEDISDYVTMENDIDPSTIGDYTITFTLDYKGEVKTISRKVFYRESGCSVIENTNVTKCDVQWADYLHTYINLSVYYEDDEYHGQTSAIFNNIENIISHYHELSDKYDTYRGVTNIHDINLQPTITHVIDQDLYDLISFALDHQEDVDNRFNMALGPVLSLWHDSREACTDIYTETICELPTSSALQAANQYTDPSKIILDPESLSITMEAKMSLDLGGVSKGYISDKITEYLDSLNLSSYLLNNGTSNISIGGTHPTRENGKFILAVTDPSNPFGGYYATVYLNPGDQMVTSGDYQQYFIFENEQYHHIINPTTLMPDHYSRSVSIITQDSAGLADLYSTAIFTMSIAEGKEFVNNIEGLEAIWYDINGDIQFSNNFEELYLLKLYN